VTSLLRGPAFIVGSGRSGTHWIARSLAAHPEIRATIEVQPMFRWATRLALAPVANRHLLRRLILAYRLQVLRSIPRLYLDKSHPCLWLAEELHEAFPRAQFLGMEREPYATVASMLNHPGVLGWHRRWREFPVPNRFLGIDAATAEHYDELPIAARCALRWRSHHERMTELETGLGDRFVRIRYEAFAADPTAELERLRQRLALSRPFPVPEVRTASLQKWRERLGDADIAAIRGVVGFGPPGS
jgi:hypothetical protein